MTAFSSPLVAYHNDAGLKASVLQQVELHRRQDEIVQGRYWRGGKGCAVGCLTHNPGGGHELYESLWGIPEVLAHLEDAVFEWLPEAAAVLWPGRFMGAIRVGADLSLVWPRFAVWLMTDPVWGVEHATEEAGVKAVCRMVADGYERVIDGTLTDEHADAVTKAARAAGAAGAAWAAGAARAAWAARDARATFASATADKLIELLEAA